MTIKTCTIKTPTGRLEIEYGLNKIKEWRPYFSITGSLYEGRSREPITCGCIHDVILDNCLDFIDLVDLHLSDINGVPMHALGNGYYYYAEGLRDDGRRAFYPTEKTRAEAIKQCEATAINIFAAQYPHFTRDEIDDIFTAVMDQPRYITNKYTSAIFREAIAHVKTIKAPYTALVVARNNEALAKHLRITEAEAAEIPAGLTEQEFNEREILPRLARWKAEAEAAIKKYNLD